MKHNFLKTLKKAAEVVKNDKINSVNDQIRTEWESIQNSVSAVKEILVKSDFVAADIKETKGYKDTTKNTSSMLPGGNRKKRVVGKKAQLPGEGTVQSNISALAKNDGDDITNLEPHEKYEPGLFAKIKNKEGFHRVIRYHPRPKDSKVNIAAQYNLEGIGLVPEGMIEKMVYGDEDNYEELQKADEWTSNTEASVNLRNIEKDKEDAAKRWLDYIQVTPSATPLDLVDFKSFLKSLSQSYGSINHKEFELHPNYTESQKFISYLTSPEMAGSNWSDKLLDSTIPLTNDQFINLTKKQRFDESFNKQYGTRIAEDPRFRERIIDEVPMIAGTNFRNIWGGVFSPDELEKAYNNFSKNSEGSAPGILTRLIKHPDSSIEQKMLNLHYNVDSGLLNRQIQTMHDAKNGIGGETGEKMLNALTFDHVLSAMNEADPGIPGTAAKAAELAKPDDLNRFLDIQKNGEGYDHPVMGNLDPQEYSSLTQRLLQYGENIRPDNIEHFLLSPDPGDVVVAKNKNIPSDIIEKVYNVSHDSVRPSLAGLMAMHPNASQSVIQHAVASDDPNIQRGVINNPNLTSDDINTFLSRDPEKPEVEKALAHPNIDPKFVENYYKSNPSESDLHVKMNSHKLRKLRDHIEDSGGSIKKGKLKQAGYNVDAMGLGGAVDDQGILSSDAVQKKIDDMPSTLYSHSTDHYGDDYAGVSWNDVYEQDDEAYSDIRDNFSKENKEHTTYGEYLKENSKLDDIYNNMSDEATTAYKKYYNSQGADKDSQKEDPKQFFEDFMTHSQEAHDWHLRDGFSGDMDTVMPEKEFNNYYDDDYDYQDLINEYNQEDLYNSDPSDYPELNHIKPDKDNYSTAHYDDAMDTGKQRHTPERSEVFQLNLHPLQITKMKQAGVWDTYQMIDKLSRYSGHPTGNNGLGWVRYTKEDDGIHIDELQSDLSQKLNSTLSDARKAVEDGTNPYMRGMGMNAKDFLEKVPDDKVRQIQDIVWNGKKSSDVLHSSFMQYMRNSGEENSPVHMWTPESKAIMSGWEIPETEDKYGNAITLKHFTQLHPHILKEKLDDAKDTFEDLKDHHKKGDIDKNTDEWSTKKPKEWWKYTNEGSNDQNHIYEGYVLKNYDTFDFTAHEQPPTTKGQNNKIILDEAGIRERKGSHDESYDNYDEAIDAFKKGNLKHYTKLKPHNQEKVAKQAKENYQKEMEQGLPRIHKEIKRPRDYDSVFSPQNWKTWMPHFSGGDDNHPRAYFIEEPEAGGKGTPLPTHAIETYNHTPKKEGFEKDTYGKLETQHNPKLSGAATWSEKVRKSPSLVAIIESLKKKQGVPKGVSPSKHERCVREVKKQGQKYNPYAVCNAAMKKTTKQTSLVKALKFFEKNPISKLAKMDDDWGTLEPSKIHKPAEKERIILDNSHSHSDWSDDTMKHWLGLHLHNPIQIGETTATSRYGEGIGFFGRGGDRPHSLLKGPMYLPGWNLEHPDKISHMSDPNFSTAHREAAFYRMSKHFGLDHYIPGTGIFKHPETGNPWSAMNFQKNLRKAEPFWLRENKNRFGSDIHKLAIMDNILGNYDRHSGNYRVGSGDSLHMIDHGLSFNYGNSDYSFYKTTPSYAMGLEDEEIPHDVHHWIQNLNIPNMLKTMQKSGAPQEITNNLEERLNSAKQWSANILSSKEPITVDRRDPQKKPGLNTLNTFYGLQHAIGMDYDENKKQKLKEAVLNRRINSGWNAVEGLRNSPEIKTNFANLPKTKIAKPKLAETKILQDPEETRMRKSGEIMRDGDYTLYANNFQDGKLVGQDEIGVIKIRFGKVVDVSGDLPIHKGPVTTATQFALDRLSNGFNVLKYTPIPSTGI